MRKEFFTNQSTASTEMFLLNCFYLNEYLENKLSAFFFLSFLFRKNPRSVCVFLFLAALIFNGRGRTQRPKVPNRVYPDQTRFFSLSILLCFTYLETHYNSITCTHRQLNLLHNFLRKFIKEMNFI